MNKWDMIAANVGTEKHAKSNDRLKNATPHIGLSKNNTHHHKNTIEHYSQIQTGTDENIDTHTVEMTGPPSHIHTGTPMVNNQKLKTNDYVDPGLNNMVGPELANEVDPELANEVDPELANKVDPELANRVGSELAKVDPGTTKYADYGLGIDAKPLEDRYTNQTNIFASTNRHTTTHKETKQISKQNLGNQNSDDARKMRGHHTTKPLRKHKSQNNVHAIVQSNQYRFDYKYPEDTTMTTEHVLNNNMDVMEYFHTDGIVPYICEWDRHNNELLSPKYCELHMTRQSNNSNIAESFLLYINLEKVCDFVCHVYIGNQSSNDTRTSDKSLVSMCGEIWNESYWCINHPLTSISMLHTPGILSQLCDWYGDQSIDFNSIKIKDAPLFAKVSMGVVWGHPDIGLIPGALNSGCDVAYFRKYVQSWYACITSNDINHIGCNNKLESMSPAKPLRWVYNTWNTHCRTNVACGALRDAMINFLDMCCILSRYGPPSIVCEAFRANQSLEEIYQQSDLNSITQSIKAATVTMVESYDNLTFHSMVKNSCDEDRDECVGYIFNMPRSPLRKVISSNNHIVQTLLGTAKSELHTFLSNAEKATNSLCSAICRDKTPCMNPINCRHHRHHRQRRRHRHN
jgi:hypothetical protein